MRFARLILLKVRSNEGRIVVLLGEQEVNDSTVDVSSTCTHHQTFVRSKSHRGVDALPIEDSSHRSTTADMGSHDLGLRAI